MIPEIRKLGITVAIGHSGADYETSWDAIRKGAQSCTHTFNAMKLLHQHFPAIMGAALESDIYCEAICDGRHLHPEPASFEGEGSGPCGCHHGFHYGSRSSRWKIQAWGQ